MKVLILLIASVAIAKYVFLIWSTLSAWSRESSRTQLKERFSDPDRLRGL